MAGDGGNDPHGGVERGICSRFTVRAHVRTKRHVLRQMLERRDGRSINMATVASSLKIVPSLAADPISEAAVVGLTKSLAADYTASNIRVNAICTGTVDSPRLHERWHITVDFEAARRAFIGRQPTGPSRGRERVLISPFIWLTQPI